MLSCLGCGLMVSAQNDTMHENSINAAYNRQIALTGDLYYGREHTGYPQKLTGTPYYNSNDWQKGTVVFNGRLYEGVNLKYDLITDQLIVLHPNNFFAVTLFPEKVSSFTIGNDQFIYVPANNAAGIKQPGFYLQLASGKLTILAKRSKRIEEATTTGELERTVVESASYWAVKNGVAYPIGGEESVLALVDEQARQIRATLREKGIRFRKAKEAALLEIATIYNQSAD